MEEQVPPATAAANERNAKPANNGTYIIQIPKDQVYRIPPPEHAEIVERNRNNVKDASASGGRHGRCLCWFFTILLVLAFLATVAFCVWKFTLDPQPPVFAAIHVDVKELPAAKKAGLPPGFQITLTSFNPNGANDIKVEQGTAALKYQGKEISKGRFPAMDHGAGRTRTIELVLVGSARGGLPKELQEARSPKRKHKKPVKLKLEMELPMKMMTWIFTKEGKVKYECDLELSSLGENANLLSDQCRRE